VRATPILALEVEPGTVDASGLFSWEAVCWSPESLERRQITCSGIRNVSDHPAILEKLAVAYHQNSQYLPALKVYDRLIELVRPPRKPGMKQGMF